MECTTQQFSISIIDGFMIQGGDIDDMNGAGGYAGIWSGYCNGQMSGSDGEIYTSENCRNDWTVPDEADNGLLHAPSVIAMAKTSAPNTAGSQFYDLVLLIVLKSP